MERIPACMLDACPTFPQIVRSMTAQSRVITVRAMLVLALIVGAVSLCIRQCGQTQLSGQAPAPPAPTLEPLAHKNAPDLVREFDNRVLVSQDAQPDVIPSLITGLRVTVSNAEGGSIGSANLFVTRASTTWDGASDLAPQVESETWYSMTNLLGIALFRDLPTAEPLVVALKKSDQWEREAGTITLMPGRLLDFRIIVGAGVTINGVLRNQLGEPISGHHVQLIFDRRYACRYLSEYEEPIQQRTTDQLGRFLMEDVPAGTWLLGPAASPISDRSGLAVAVSSLASVIQLGGGDKVVNIVLTADCGLAIAGTVMEGGVPISSPMYVFATSADGRGVLDTRSSQAGEFVLGPIASGNYWLQARSFGDVSHADSDPVLTSPGSQRVVLEVKRGCDLAVRVYRADTGLSAPGTLTLVGTSVRGDPVRLVVAGGTGDYVFRGLSRGTYDLVAITPDGRAAVRRCVTLDSTNSVVEQTLQVEVGASLQIENMTAELADCQVLVAGILLDTLSIAPGCKRSLTVPVGTTSIRAMSDRLRTSPNTTVLEQGQFVIIAILETH